MALCRISRSSSSRSSPGQKLARAFGQGLLIRQLLHWQRQGQQLPAGCDPELLHQWRLTARRLIGTLRWLEATRCRGARGLRRQVQQLLRHSSELRDLDLVIAQVQRCNAVSPRGGLGGVLCQIRRERVARSRAFIKILERRQVNKLLAALAVSARRPLPRDGPSVAAVARPLLGERQRVMKRRARTARHRATAQARHQLRLAAKTLRYVAEPLEPLFGEPMRLYLRRLRGLLALLGRLNDAQHTVESVRVLLARQPGLALPAQQALEALCRAQQRQLRRSLPQVDGACRRVRGHAWKALRAALKAAESQPAIIRTSRASMRSQCRLSKKAST